MKGEALCSESRGTLSNDYRRAAPYSKLETPPGRVCTQEASGTRRPARESPGAPSWRRPIRQVHPAAGRTSATGVPDRRLGRHGLVEVELDLVGQAFKK